MRPLGMYREGDTLAHRLDPRTKLLFVLLYVVAAFLAQSAPVLVLVALVAAGSLAAGGAGPRQAARALRPFVWLMLFVLVFDTLFVNSGEVLFQAGVVCVSTGGIRFAVVSVVRFACVLVGTSALMATTSPTALSDGAGLLLAPLERLGLRTHNVSVALGMTLRFVPVVVEEFERVREAQEGRGADFGGGVKDRLSAYVPVVVPLFQSALRRADTLALAMENREYDAACPRTCLRDYRMAARDWAVLALVAALAALAAVDFIVA